MTGLAILMASGCSLPPGEKWTQLNQQGGPSGGHAVRVPGVGVPQTGRTPSAERARGDARYVYSPFTTPRKLVDVSIYQPGEEVLCPYTGLAFVVPSRQPGVIASPPPVRSVEAPVTEVVSNSNSPLVTDPAPRRVETAEAAPVRPSPPPVVPVVPSLEPVQPAPPAVTAAPPPSAPATAPEPAPAIHPPPLAPSSPPPPASAVAKAKNDIPYGTWVAGQPGFVYSPFAKKSQLVDVAGTAPGVVVKCPYTNKPFRVPEVLGEDVKPSGTPSSEPPPAIAETPAPAPAPAPSPPTPPAPQTPPPGSLASPQR